MDKEKIKAVLDHMQKTLDDAVQRRREYSEAIGARWGDDFGVVVGDISAVSSVFLKHLTLAGMLGLPADKLALLATESGSLQRHLFEAVLRLRFKEDDPKRFEAMRCVESIFERMADNEADLAGVMAKSNIQLSQLMKNGD
jgi:hypothetical protein